LVGFNEIEYIYLLIWQWVTFLEPPCILSKYVALDVLVSWTVFCLYGTCINQQLRQTCLLH